MNKAFLVTILAVVSGCAAQKPSEHERLAALPPPRNWVLESVWTFAVVDTKLELIQSMTVRLTKSKAEACASGDWYRAEVLTREPVHLQSDDTAAYQVSGRAFFMNLTANLCDVDNDYQGELTEAGISGSYWSGGPWGVARKWVSSTP